MPLSRRLLLTALAGSAISPLARAQAYPSKPIKLIVPFPAGGGGDNLARLTMSRVATELGQPIVFENLAGAGGNIGCAAAARAPADGYTLLYGTNGTHGINQTLYKRPGFDALKDFEPVSRLTSIAAMVVIRPGLPVATMGELLKLLKANPGKYTFASAGNGTTSHLSGEILKAEAGLAVVHIPYRGGAAAITDVIGGQVDFMIDVMPNTAPQVRGGRLKGLAVSTAKRVPGFADMPTIAESGLPGFNVGAWDAIFAPAGTPKAIVDQVNAAIQKALADPELRNQLASRGADVVGGSPQELKTFMAQEIERWGAAVKRSGASVD
jgi:tripartite-type tricarboxylate transporter receptor subunit TctC